MVQALSRRKLNGVSLIFAGMTMRLWVRRILTVMGAGLVDWAKVGVNRNARLAARIRSRSMRRIIPEVLAIAKAANAFHLSTRIWPRIGKDFASRCGWHWTRML